MTISLTTICPGPFYRATCEGNNVTFLASRCEDSQCTLCTKHGTRPGSNVVDLGQAGCIPSDFLYTSFINANVATSQPTPVPTRSPTLSPIPTVTDSCEWTYDFYESYSACLSPIPVAPTETARIYADGNCYDSRTESLGYYRAGCLDGELTFEATQCDEDCLTCSVEEEVFSGYNYTSGECSSFFNISYAWILRGDCDQSTCIEATLTPWPTETEVPSDTFDPSMEPTATTTPQPATTMPISATSIPTVVREVTPETPKPSTVQVAGGSEEDADSLMPVDKEIPVESPILTDEVPTAVEEPGPTATPEKSSSSDASSSVVLFLPLLLAPLLLLFTPSLAIR